MKDKDNQWSTEKLKLKYEQDTLVQQYQDLEKQLADLQEKISQVSLRLVLGIYLMHGYYGLEMLTTP